MTGHITTDELKEAQEALVVVKAELVAARTERDETLAYSIAVKSIIAELEENNRRLVAQRDKLEVEVHSLQHRCQALRDELDATKRDLLALAQEDTADAH